MLKQVNECVFEDEAGIMWLDIGRVNNLDDLDLTTFDIIHIRGTEYELQGRRPSDGWWWVMPYQIDLDNEPHCDPRVVITSAPAKTV